MVTLAGIVCIRNGFRLDYPWTQCVKSLLPICDEVVVCDCDSDDGTRGYLDVWSRTENKITVVNFPWTDPKGDPDWYPTWINYARQHASCEWIIHMDADEVIHEDDHELIRRATEEKSVRLFNRLNFWRDPWHLIPNGKCCGTLVLRLAGQKMPIPSDYPYKDSAPTEAIARDSKIRCFHYGFLRHREQFFLKAREVQRIWANSYDPRLEAADKAGGRWMEHEGVTGWENQLEEYRGTHPAIIKDWLSERGYSSMV